MAEKSGAIVPNNELGQAPTPRANGKEASEKVKTQKECTSELLSD
jgi:hypothetical protein